jgi:NADH dehydrogenase [ubiquinone] 1 alpha subcomplex assembly factor 5
MSQELIFDRNLLIKRRSSKVGSIHKSDFLIKRSLETIIESLNAMTNKFPNILNLGCRKSYGTDYLKNRAGTRSVIETDISFEFLRDSSHLNRIICDEESLPFASNQFDLIVSVLNFHNINDLPGTLIQLQRMLKPKGVLVASMFGELNLDNIAQMLIKAELSASGGISPRIFPSVQIKQMGSLLQRAGFSMPVVDKDTVNVQYSNPMKLLHDLQNMGESNILINRNKKYPGKRIWSNFVNEGKIIAKFELLNIMASKD